MFGPSAPSSMKECGRRGRGGTEVYAVIYSECGVQTQRSTFAPSSMSLALQRACKNSSAIHSYRRRFQNHSNTEHLPARRVFIPYTPSSQPEDRRTLRQVELSSTLSMRSDSSP